MSLPGSVIPGSRAQEARSPRAHAEVGFRAQRRGLWSVTAAVIGVLGGTLTATAPRERIGQEKKADINEESG